jgi:hypothetical protein
LPVLAWTGVNRILAARIGPVPGIANSWMQLANVDLFRDAIPTNVLPVLAWTGVNRILAARIVASAVTWTGVPAVTVAIFPNDLACMIQYRLFEKCFPAILTPPNLSQARLVQSEVPFDHVLTYGRRSNTFA